MYFKYRTGVDKEKTKLEREKAAEAIDDVYDIDAQATQDQINKAERVITIYLKTAASGLKTNINVMAYI